MKTVVITGSCGSIGTSLCNKFKESGWNVIGIDKRGDLKCDLSSPEEITKLNLNCEIYCLIKKELVH